MSLQFWFTQKVVLYLILEVELGGGQNLGIAISFIKECLTQTSKEIHQGGSLGEGTSGGNLGSEGFLTPDLFHSTSFESWG